MPNIYAPRRRVLKPSPWRFSRREVASQWQGYLDGLELVSPAWLGEGSIASNLLGQDGTITNPSWDESGDVGRYLSFSGGSSNDHVSYPDSELPDFVVDTIDFSFAVFVRVDTGVNQDNSRIFHRTENATNSDVWQMSIRPDTEGYVWSLRKGDTQYDVITGDSALADDQWQLVVGTTEWSGATPTMEVWVGRTVSTAASANAFGEGDDNSIYIAKRRGSLTNSFQGDVAMAAVWSRKLSDGEVLQLFDDPFGPIRAERQVVVSAAAGAGFGVTHSMRNPGL